MSRARRGRSQRTSTPLAPDTQLFGSTIAMITIWVVCGGDAPRNPLVLLLLAVSGTWLLCLSLYQGGLSLLADLPFRARLLAVVVIGVPLIQLVPLPPAVWQSMPSRATAAAELSAVGAADSWHPLTLSVLATARTALVCFWLFGLALALFQLSSQRVRQLFALLFVLALANMAIGFVQILSGGAVFDLYVSSHRGMAIGFFANKNHSGLFMALAFLTGYAAIRRRAGQSHHDAAFAGPVVVTSLCLVMFAALLATNSRAALLFGTFSLGFAGLMAWDGRLGRRGWGVGVGVLAAISVTAVFSQTEVASRSLARFGIIDSDLRWPFWQRSWPLVGQYFPTGAGIGTFPTIFAASERLAWVKPTYLNHAHNDYLEQLIEIGVAAPLLWLVFLAATLPAVVAAWRSRRRTEEGWALIAAAIVFLYVIHSGFDYPLRRPGTAVVFVFALTLLLRFGRTRTVARQDEVCEAAPE